MQQLWTVQFQVSPGIWKICQDIIVTGDVEDEAKVACIFFTEEDAKTNLKQWQEYQDPALYRTAKVYICDVAK